MRKIFFTIFVLNSFILFSQNIVIIEGFNRNSFYDFIENDGIYHSSYISSYAYVSKIGIDNIKTKKSTLRFTLSYENYGGTVQAGEGGVGSGSDTYLEINKSIVSLAVFPFNFKLFKKIDLNFGFEFSRLFNESFKGNRSGWHFINDPGSRFSWISDLHDDYDRLALNLISD